MSGEFPVFRATDDRIDLRYLMHWFRLPSTLKIVEAQCTGSTPLTRNRFKENFFTKLSIPLPPLSEQRRIVARIEELAGKIAEAKRLRAEAITNVEQLATVSINQVIESLASNSLMNDSGILTMICGQHLMQ